MNAKLDQLEEDAQTVARNYATQRRQRAGVRRADARVASSRPASSSTRSSQNQPFVFGDSNTSASLDVERDPVAREADAQPDVLERGTVERAAAASPRWRSRSRPRAVVILLSDSLADPLSSLQLIERRLLVAGLIGLLFAVVAGYAARIDAREAGSGGSSARPSGSPADASTSRWSTRATTSSASSRARVRAHARAARQARPRPQRVHRQRVARAAHAALLARRLPRADGGRGARRGDPAGVPRDDARAGRSAGEARDRPARPLAARRRPDAGRARAGRPRRGRAARRGGVQRAGRAQEHALEVVVAGQPDRARRRAARAPGRAARCVDNALVHTPDRDARDAAGAGPTASTPTSRSRTTGPGSRPSTSPTSSTASTAARATIASGSGLGLAIARELATMMDGEVELESRAGPHGRARRARRCADLGHGRAGASPFSRENGERRRYSEPHARRRPRSSVARGRLPRRRSRARGRLRCRLDRRRRAASARSSSRRLPTGVRSGRARRGAAARQRLRPGEDLREPLRGVSSRSTRTSRTASARRAPASSSRTRVTCSRTRTSSRPRPPRARRCKGADRIYVVFADGDRIPGSIVGWDLFNDIGLVKVDPKDHAVSPRPARRLEPRRRRRAGRGDREPVRAGELARRRRRLGDPALDRVAHVRLRRLRCDPDRRADQPRQLGRPAARRPRPRDRDQRPDPLRLRERRGSRLRDPDQLRAPFDGAADLAPARSPTPTSA